jgi:hypothetical protein
MITTAMANIGYRITATQNKFQLPYILCHPKGRVYRTFLGHIVEMVNPFLKWKFGINQILGEQAEDLAKMGVSLMMEVWVESQTFLEMKIQVTIKHLSSNSC